MNKIYQCIFYFIQQLTYCITHTSSQINNQSITNFKLQQQEIFSDKKYFPSNQQMLLGTRNQKQTGLEHLTNPQTYDLLQRRQKQKQLLDLINQKDQTIIILHQVNTRLGAQLAILQKKLGIDSENIIRELQNLKQISVGFHYEVEHLEYLDHLFKAYDENNIKQKKLIAMLYSELQDSERKAENLVRDNEFLLNEMQTKCKQILQIYQKGFPQDNLVQTYNKLQRETQVDLIQTLRQQNQYLTKYSSQLQQKFMRLQVQFDQSRNTAQKYFQTYKDQAQQLKQAFMKNDDLTKVKQVLQRKFDQISQENIELESAKELLQAKAAKYQQELKNTRNQFYAVKKTGKQDTDKVQAQLDSLKIQYQSTSKRQRQSFNKLMIYQRQNQTLKQSNRSLKRQLQKTKLDFQNTIKMLQAYETKITNNQKKTKAMKEFVDQTKENLNAVILQKEKAQLKIDQLEKQNQSLRNKHLDQCSQLKHSFQKIINNLNQKINLLQTTKQDLSNDLHQRQISSKNQHQKLKRINTQLRTQNSNLLQSMRSSSGSDIVTKIRQLQQKNQNMNKLVMQAESRLREQKELDEEMIDNLRNEVRDVNRQLEKQRNNSSNYLRELTQVKSKLSIMTNEKECKENQLIRLQKLLDQKTYSNVEQRDWKVKDLQQKLQQAVQREKKIRVQAIEKLQKYDQTQRELQMEYRNIIAGLERQIEELKRKLRKKRQE